jgi:hypothetical protein
MLHAYDVARLLSTTTPFDIAIARAVFVGIVSGLQILRRTLMHFNRIQCGARFPK